MADQIYYYHKDTFNVVSETHIQMSKDSYKDYQKIGTMYELRLFLQGVMQENHQLKFMLRQKTIS